MDMLQEEIEPTGEGYKINDELTIAYLLWVDDVISCVEGNENQEEILKRVDDFAIRHKLKWGAAKCRVMRIGKHKEEEKDWNLGDVTIKEADTYRYLGDVISRDGKNVKNIEARKHKMTISVAAVNAIAASDALKYIETAVLIELHEKIVLSALLTNAESWTLNAGNKDEMDRIETQALKYLFDLPAHTPSHAILYSLGTLYTRHRIDQKRLICLHRILSANNDAWTKRTLMALVDQNIGWGKSIKETLEEYDLPTDFGTIINATKGQWKRAVVRKIEIQNRRRLLEDCYKTIQEEKTEKTKTKHIIDIINDETYVRLINQELLKCTKQQTKTLIIARFKMLECGMNFKGTMKELCGVCKTVDDENHRLNYCIRFKDKNRYDSATKLNFADVYSNDINILKNIISHIERLWNVKTAHGTICQ